MSRGSKLENVGVYIQIIDKERWKRRNEERSTLWGTQCRNGWSNLCRGTVGHARGRGGATGARDLGEGVIAVKGAPWPRPKKREKSKTWGGAKDRGMEKTERHGEDSRVLFSPFVGQIGGKKKNYLRKKRGEPVWFKQKARGPAPWKSKGQTVTSIGWGSGATFYSQIAGGA